MHIYVQVFYGHMFPFLLDVWLEFVIFIAIPFVSDFTKLIPQILYFLSWLATEISA